MARPLKSGLEFWRKDTNFYADPKVHKLGRRCGAAGLAILDSIFCKIYHEGYYIVLDEDMIEDLADETFTTPALVSRAVETAVEVGFFHEDLYRRNSVLTGLSLQLRYFSATSRRQKPDSTLQYLLLSGITESNNGVNADNNGVNADNNSENNKHININTYSSSYSSIVDKEKEEEIFQIFFLKNIEHYRDEFRRFVKFYSDRGWNTTAGEPVTDVLGLAQAWDPHEERKKFSEKAVTLLSEMNNELRIHGKGIEERKLLRDVDGIWFQDGQILIQCTEALQDWLELNIDKVEPVIRRYGRSVTYKVKL